MRTLLDKVGVIDFKYNLLREKNSFNIFEILRNISDEVNLHSQFICQLLDENGSHNQRSKFAELFFKVIGVENFNLESYQTRKEYKNIDILISNDTQAIIIENKIWAKDQDKQLERYYNIIKEEKYSDIKIYYLTLKGHEPSDSSVGILNKETNINLISYTFHIDNWIEKCIESSSKFPIIRETLIQYQKLISKLTGNTMENEQTKEIINLLSENDNILKAKLIAESWIHIQWHTEFDFWSDFEEVINKKYKIVEHQKYSPDTLNNVIHQSRNRNPYFGLMFQIGTFKNQKIYLFIERAWSDVYYGITIKNEEDRLISNNDEFTELAKKIEQYCLWGRESQWLGGNWLEPRIDFENFSSENTLKLINKDFRQNYITQNWAKIEAFIRNCTSEIEALSANMD